MFKKRQNMNKSQASLGKKIYSVVMSVMMVLSLWPSGATTALANVASSVEPGTYGNYTYELNTTKDAFSTDKYKAYRDSRAETMLGVAGSFHITAFEEMTIGSHVYGNILTKTLTGNNNFGLDTRYDNAYGYKGLSYIQNYPNPNGNVDGHNDGLFVIGSDNTVTTVDNGNHLAVNGTQFNQPNSILQDADTSTTPFIDLDAVKTQTVNVSNDLAGVADVGAAVKNENGNIYIDYEGDSGCAYVSLTADELNNMNELYVRGMALNGECSVLINVDMGTTKQLNLSKVHVLSPDGQDMGTGETDSTVGYVMFNIKNSTSDMTISLSDRVLASVLAPNSTINLGGSAAGTYIGTKVNVTAESHARPFRGTLKPVETGVSVNKQWLDAYGEAEFDAVKSTHKPVTVQLYQSVNGGDFVAYGDPVQLSNDNNWSHSWNGLSKKDRQGNTYEYKVEEVSSTNDYTSSVAGNESGTSWTITNRHVAVGKVSVSKTWDDEDNKDAVRPSEVTVHIVRSTDGTNWENYGDAITLNAKNNWSATVDQLPLKDADGNAYTYSVVEDEVKGYETSDITLVNDKADVDADGNTHWTYTVTNTRAPKKQTTEVSVDKTWLGADGKVESGDHPAVKVQLYQSKNGGAETAYGDEVELSADTNWEYTWSDLISVDVDPSAYDSEAGDYKVNNYTYSVKEVEVPENYTATVTRDDNSNSWHITNKCKVTKGKLTVTKVWDDSDNADKIQPDSVTVKVTRQVAGGTAEDVKTGIVLNEGNNWSQTIENLEIRNATGEEYIYSVVEENVPSGYTSNVELTESGEVDGIKTWSYTVTNSHSTTLEYTSLSVTKQWLKANGSAESDDVVNAHGAVQVQLYKKAAGGQFVAEGDPVELSSSNKWSYAWKDLVKTDAYGVSYEYKVAEVDAPADYDSAVSNDGTSWTITNTRKATASLSIEKKWEDSDNLDGLRPATVTVKITRTAEGGKAETYKDNVVLSAANGWKYSESGLDATDANGKAYIYSVSEHEVEDYTGEVTCTQGTDADGNVTWSFTATNTHGARYQETEVSVNKQWLKANGSAESDEVVNAHGAVKVQLYKSVNGGEFEPEGKTVELSRDNNWSYTWTGLVKTGKDGSSYTYMVREAFKLSGYEASYEVDGNAWTIKNTKVATGKLSVTKVWDDSDDADKIQPASVTVEVTRSAGGVKDKSFSQTLTLSAENGWAASLDGLALKNSDGTKYEYSVSEAQVDGYDSKVELVSTGDDGEGNTTWSYTVTNSHEARYEETEVFVTKQWLKANGSAESDDVANAHGVVQVQLYQSVNGGEFKAEGDPVELSSTNKWAYTWSGLVKTDAFGTSYTYDVREVGSTEGYVSDVTNNGNDFKVTNKKVANVTVAVEKAWNDNNDVDGLRPEELVVAVKRSVNGTEDADFSQTLTLNEDNGWKAQLTGLDKTDSDNNEYVYSASEAQVEGYTGDALTPVKSTDADGNTVWTYSLVNTHEQAKTSVKVSKVWDDAQNQDGLRASRVTVDVKRRVEGVEGSETVKTLELSEANDWTATLDDLAVNGPDGAYTYYVEEAKVEGYDASVKTVTPDESEDGAWTFTVTNRHEAAKTEIDVKKVWEDNDDFELLRPEEVKIQLGTKAADGTFTALEGYDPVVLNEANNWGAEGKCGWFDLAVYSNGEKINYTVQELDVAEGYEPQVSDGLSTDDGKSYTFTVTNIHTSDEKMEFALTGYSVASVTEVLEADDVCYVDPKIYKKLVGRKLEAGEFKFQLVNEETGAVVSETTNDEAGMVDFDAAANVAPTGMDASCLKFTAEGTYTYVVREVSETKDTTVNYSDEIVKFVVVVSRDADGKLIADGGHYYCYANASDTMGVKSDPDQHPTITNTVKGIMLGLTKVDESGNGLPGAVYGLYTMGADGNEVLVASSPSDVDGKMTFGSVSENYIAEDAEYWFREISAPEGYQLSYDELTHFKVSHDKNGYYLVDLDGNKLTETVAPGTAIPFTRTAVDKALSAEVLKLDAARNAVKGAKLAVYEADTNKQLDEWVSDGTGHKIGGLLANKNYVLRELEAPEGYKKAADVTFTLSSDGLVTTVSGGKTTVNEQSVVNVCTAGNSLSLIDYRVDELTEEQEKKREVYKENGKEISKERYEEIVYKRKGQSNVIPYTGDNTKSGLGLVMGAVVVVVAAGIFWYRSRSND